MDACPIISRPIRPAAFPAPLDRFTHAPLVRFFVYNGVHPDGFQPEVLAEWKNFLDLYVARKVPKNMHILAGGGGLTIGGLTIGGLLCFGKDPQRHYPYARVTAIRFHGDDVANQFDDRGEFGQRARWPPPAGWNTSVIRGCGGRR